MRSFDLAQLDVGHLRDHGPTLHAFTFRHRFEPGAEHASTTDDRDSCPA